MTLSLREATLADVEALAGLHTRVWDRTYRPITSAIEKLGITLERQREVWSEVLSRDPRPEIVVLAFRDERLVGFVCAGPAQDEPPIATAEVLAIYVEADAQRRGVGWALIKRAFETLADRGHRRVALWVREDNPARGFCERLGGRAVARRSRDWEGGKLYRLGYLWDGSDA